MAWLLNNFYCAFNFSLIVFPYIPIWYKLSFNLLRYAIYKILLSFAHNRINFDFTLIIQLPLNDEHWCKAEAIDFLQFPSDIYRHLLRVFNLSLITKEFSFSPML
jgi:hypothetical protein